jgi:hypothetical protein
LAGIYGAVRNTTGNPAQINTSWMNPKGP